MALVLALLLQDDPAALVEQLRSDSIEERDEAARKLKALGKAAEKELRKAVDDRDPEVAHTAKYLLRFIEYQDLLPAAIRKAFPGAADRLARGDDHEATTLLFEAARIQSLSADDLQVLAPLAVRGVKTDAERLGVLDLLSTWKLTAGMIPILEWFSSPNDNVRNATVETLARLQPKGMLDPLRAKLRSETPSVRVCAAAALAKLGLAEAGRDLLALLDDREAEVRFAAMRALGMLRVKESVAPLRTLLAHADPAVRVEAIAALEFFGDPAPILPLLRDPETDVRVAAIGAVAGFGAQSAIPDLRAALGDPEDDVVEAAIDALVALDAKEAGADLMRLLPRESAIQALGELRAAEAGPAILKLLDSESASTRRTAVRTLGSIQHLPAIGKIARMLKEDPDEDVRYEAEDALGSFRGKEALPAFRALLEDPNATVRIAALGALADISGVDSAKMVLELLRDPELEVRRTALSVLDDLGYREAVPEIVKLFDDPDLGADAIRTASRLGAAVPAKYLDHERAEVRAAAVQALAQPEHLPKLAARLADPDPSVRIQAIEAMRTLRAKEHAPAIAKLLADADAEVQARALSTLTELRAPEALPALRKLLKDEDADRRRSAVQQLAKYAEGVPSLVEALGDASLEVRHEAIRALTDLRAAEALPKIAGLLPDLPAIDAVGRLGTKEHLRHLEPLLRDVSGDVRAAALRAMARIGCPIGPVVAALDDPVAQVVGEAIDALADLGARDQSARIATFLAHREASVRTAAARALAWLDARGEIEGVRRLLSDETPSVRGAAAEALGDLGGKESDLRPLLSDQDDYVRGCAAFGLAYLGVTGAADEILKLASDPRQPDWMRTNAIWAVTKMQARDAAPALRVLLHDPDPQLRWQCAWSLAQLGDRESTADLRALLADRNGDVRASSSAALARLGSREGVETLFRASDQGIVVILEDLNQLRQPELSDRLRGRKPARDLVGTLEEIWAAIEKESGLKVERPDDSEFRRKRTRVRTFGGTASLYDAMADTSGYGFEFILEADRVRVVPREAALKFWKEWAAGK